MHWRYADAIPSRLEFKAMRALGHRVTLLIHFSSPVPEVHSTEPFFSCLSLVANIWSQRALQKTDVMSM